MSEDTPIDVAQVSLDAILEMRDEYRREMDCQIVHDSWHARRFTASYLLRVHDQVVGYGSVGGAPGDSKDRLKEFFVRPPFRGHALALFRQLVTVSGAQSVESQTNDRLLLLMLYDCTTAVSTDTILFADGATTALQPPIDRVRFRHLTPTDHATVFSHTGEPVGERGLDVDGEIVATGGLLFHYNPPYGDIYMEVAPVHRQRGFGSYLVQELKRACYDLRCVPGARCDATNVASRRTLERAGMFPCARIVRGELASKASS